MNNVLELKDMWRLLLKKNIDKTLYELSYKLKLEIPGYRQMESVPRKILLTKLLQKITNNKFKYKDIYLESTSNILKKEGYDEFVIKDKVKDDEYAFLMIVQSLLLNTDQNKRRFAEALFKEHSNQYGLETDKIITKPNHSQNVDNNQLELLQSKSKKLEKDNLKLTDKVEQVKEINDNLKRIIKELRKKIKNEIQLEENYKEKQEEILSLEKVLTEKDLKIIELLSELEKKQLENKQMKNKIQTLDEKIKKYNKNIYNKKALWIANGECQLENLEINIIYIDFTENEETIKKKLNGIKEMCYISSGISGFNQDNMKCFLKNNKFTIKLKSLNNIQEVNSFMKEGCI